MVQGNILYLENNSMEQRKLWCFHLSIDWVNLPFFQGFSRDFISQSQSSEIKKNKNKTVKCNFVFQLYIKVKFNIYIISTSYVRECNNRGTVFDIFNEFYVGVFYRVYAVWKNQRKTISDSGFVLREVEKYCKNHTNEVLRDFSKAVLEKKPAVKHEESSAFSRSSSEKVESFSGVCDIQENEEEEVHLV